MQNIIFTIKEYRDPVTVVKNNRSVGVHFTISLLYEVVMYTFLFAVILFAYYLFMAFALG